MLKEPKLKYKRKVETEGWKYKKVKIEENKLYQAFLSI